MIIIKGAIYENGEMLLRPHFSGDFHTVDCTEYKTKPEIKKEYSAKHVKEFTSGMYLTWDGKKYYECEYSPHYTEDMYCLSDLSQIEFFDEETEF